MNAEFDWWLLLVGIVGGAGLVWLILAGGARSEDELAEDERRIEAEWIADALRRDGSRIDAGTVEDVLGLHRTYLVAPAPDLDPVEPASVPTGTEEPADS